MTLFTYLDHRYRTLSIELQKDYSIPKEAELKAAYSLIQFQRSFFKYLKMPILLIRYLLINFGWLAAPEPFIPMVVPAAEPQTVEVDNIN